MLGSIVLAMSLDMSSCSQRALYKDQVKLSMNQESRGFSEEDQRDFMEARQVPSNSQSPEKTKKIGKNGGRPSKKQKRNKRGQQEGQGSSNEQKDTDPCEDNTPPLWEQIMAKLIDFFDQTLQRKGFVYPPDVRGKYNKLPDVRLKWNTVVKWEKDAQLQKAASICRKEERLSEAERQTLINVMVESSAIFAEEFTAEYYQILLEVYMLTKREKEQGLNQDEINEQYALLAFEIYKNKDNRYYYFSFTFRNFKYDKNDEFKKPTSDAPYKNLINSLRAELLKLP